VLINNEIQRLTVNGRGFKRSYLKAGLDKVIIKTKRIIQKYF
jgi:hypothetical protein